MTLPLEKFDALLEQCADSYRDCGRPQGNIDLKLAHSRRVCDEARLITECLVDRGQMSKREQELAVVAALFHDIGRFPQYARYGVFDDSVSANHGLLGLKTLKASGILDGFPSRDRKCIQAAVGLHNRKSVPSNMPADFSKIVAVVRDADKLDIFPVMLKHFQPDAPANDVVLLGVERDSEKYTSAIVEQVQQQRIGDYSLMQYTNDFKLLVLSWVYDMNYAVSKRELAKRGHIESVFSLLPKKEPFQSLKKQLERDVSA